MCVEALKQLVTNPAEAIELAKKEKNYNTVAALMVIEWIFLAVATLIITRKLNVAIAVFVVGIIATLFEGLLTQVTFRTLGGKGGYKEGLTVVVYPLVPLSFGLLISTLFLLAKDIGVVVAFLLASIYAVMSVAAVYKAAKELFKVDMVTAWIGTGVLVVGTLIAIYAVSLGYLGITEIETLKGLITSAIQA